MPERRLDNAGLLMKKFLIKICIYATIICVLTSVFAAPAFATGDIVQFSEAAKLGASIVDLYGMANNTSLAYDVSSNQSALTVIENLYTEYSSNASDPYTLAAIGAAAAAAGAIAVIYDAVTGKGYIQLYQEQYISSLDGYWDYQLTDAGLVRDSITDMFNWNLNQQDTVTPISLYLHYPYYPVTNNDSIYYGYDSNHYQSITNNNGIVYALTSGTSSRWIVYFSDSPFNGSFQIKWKSNDVVSSSSSYTGSVSDPQYPDIYYSDFEVYDDYDTLSFLPYYTTRRDGFSQIGNFLNNPVPDSSVSIGPYWGDPLEHPLEITIPDNADPNYEPAPKRITTTIPWDPTWGDPLPDGVSEPEYGVPYPITDPALLNTVVPEIWNDIVANDVKIQPDPTPSDPDSPVEEVMVPFLPLEIPSFNFSLSGIWHYVVSWVQSLGSWFTAMFAMWSCLPYAMVVPVYATLVVVIVLGLYKRFIA